MNKKRSTRGDHRYAAYKVAKVMNEFKHGQLKSSSGDYVTEKDQALAIAASEAGLPRKGKKRG